MSDNIADKDQKETPEEGTASEGLKLTTRQMVQLSIVIAMGLVLLLGFVFVVTVMAIRAGGSGNESAEAVPEITVPDQDAAASAQADLPPLEGRIYVRAGERLLSLGGDETRLVLYLMTDEGEEIRVADPKTGDIVRRIEIIRGQR